MHSGILPNFPSYRDESDDADVMRGELALGRLEASVSLLAREVIPTFS